MNNDDRFLRIVGKPNVANPLHALYATERGVRWMPDKPPMSRRWRPLVDLDELVDPLLAQYEGEYGEDEDDEPTIPLGRLPSVVHEHEVLPEISEEAFKLLEQAEAPQGRPSELAMFAYRGDVCRRRSNGEAVVLYFVHLLHASGLGPHALTGHGAMVRMRAEGAIKYGQRHRPELTCFDVDIAAPCRIASTDAYQEVHVGYALHVVREGRRLTRTEIETFFVAIASFLDIGCDPSRAVPYMRAVERGLWERECNSDPFHGSGDIGWAATRAIEAANARTRDPRPVQDRIAEIRAMFARRDGWSLDGPCPNPFSQEALAESDP